MSRKTQRASALDILVDVAVASAGTAAGSRPPSSSTQRHASSTRTSHRSSHGTPSMARVSSAPSLDGYPVHSATHAMPIPVPVPIQPNSHSCYASRSPQCYASEIPSASVPIPHADGTPAINIPRAGSAPAAYSPGGYGRSTSACLSVKKSARGRRDSYTRFTADEEAMLLEGVRVYGVGNWKKILNSYQFHWKRTAVDLKDKYRNITRAKMRKLNAVASTQSSDASSVGSETDFSAMLHTPGVGSPIGMSPLSHPPLFHAAESPSPDESSVHGKHRKNFAGA